MPGPEDQKRLSDTLRIDLIREGGKALDKGVDKKAAPGLTKMDWAARRKAPDYVARSRYQELLQSLYDAALVTRMSGEIIDVNARAVEFLRHDRADLFVMTIFEVVSGADASLIETLTQNLENERFSLIQAYCMRSDGTYFPAEIAVSRLRLDEACLCFFIRDITWRVTTEQKLHLEHQALSMAGNGIVITDKGAITQFANPAFARMLAIEDVDSITGSDLREYFSDRTAAGELVEKVLSDNQTWMSEMTMTRKDDEDVHIQVSATCNRTSDGEPTGIVFSFADVTQLREAVTEGHSDLEAGAKA
jgi:PAS domain S-box-containing protein